MKETLEETLLIALAASYKKAANHPDDVISLSCFLDNMPDKSVVSEVVKTVPIELTPENIFKLIQAMKDADHYRETYLRSENDVDSLIDGWKKMRMAIYTQDGRDKDERIREAMFAFFGPPPGRDLKKIVKEYGHITTERKEYGSIATDERRGLSHAEALEALRDRHDWPTTDAVRKALKREGCIFKAT